MEFPRRWFRISRLFLPLIGIGTFLLLANPAWTLNPVAVGQQEQKATADKTAPKTKKLSRREAREAEAKQDARDALAEMVRKLEKGEYMEFMHMHSPIEEYVMSRKSGRGPSISFRDIPRFAKLAGQLKAMEDAEITVDPTGLFVTLTKVEELNFAERPTSRYTEAAEPVSKGYGKDLKQALKAAQADLKGGDYETFMQGMIPPSTRKMMIADERWEGMLESLSPDSPQVERMLDDLAMLMKAEPKIDGAIAEYQVPNVVTISVNRQEDVEQEAGKRTIRFSLIDNSWRFFDATASVAKELDAALNRDAAGDSLKSQIVLEKIGSDWRLQRFPGNDYR